ncbi:dehydratase [Desulfosporosinus fructosivorans]|uniref:Dehydratase n=1 Tax=Desulfosporosinus fructosivorans TaxID=2018669 RepID=A0A4Z0RAN4_9FIRM|nr:glycerol dehydratase reactivase beta/small subunit family protein [Desulfosporosinus fructosivorans]TGE39395.1 dehydratase [Desulfosporosinus fructosivorans]
MLPDGASVKPCVLIHVFPHFGWKEKIREVQAGLEEEGIPSLVVQVKESDVVALAFQGACASKLGVGLGIGADGLCIHYFKLPDQHPLFALNVPGTPIQWRHFGYNAARLVKGIPFKEQPLEDLAPQFVDSSLLYNLVYGIVQKVLRETDQGHGEVKHGQKSVWVN